MTSEPEKLLPVIQADRDAAASLLIQHCTMSAQMALHGDSDGTDYVQAFAKHRLSSPVSGTDMVMVPRALAEKLAKFATEWDRWQAKGSTSTERMVTFSYGQARIGLDDFRAVHAMLSASPSTPIPVIAEAGERDDEDRTADEAVDFVFDRLAEKLGLAEWRVVEGSEEWEGDVSATLSRLLIDAGIVDDETGAIAALSTPATLDNTAVEGQS